MFNSRSITRLFIRGFLKKEQLGGTQRLWCHSLTKKQSRHQIMAASRQISTTAAFLRQFQQNKEFDVTANPYFVKYSEKLKDLADKNPDEYQKKVDELSEKCKEMEKRRREELSEKPKPITGQPGSWPPKSLDEIMKVELVKDKTAEEIEKIWSEHHIHKDGVFSVIKGKEFDDVVSTGRAFPTFVYALPRDDGYEYILSQFSENNVYFTSLQMYQMVKENAQPCLTLAHFTDFKESKGMVLMAGKYDEKFLNQVEAVNLVKQMSLYYGSDSAERRHLLEAFHNSPDTFNHIDIVAEYKNMRKKVELFA